MLVRLPLSKQPVTAARLRAHRLAMAVLPGCSSGLFPSTCSQQHKADTTLGQAALQQPQEHLLLHHTNLQPDNPCLRETP